MSTSTNSSGPFLAASCGTVVKVWDALATNNVSYSKPLYFAESHGIQSTAWSPDGSILAYCGESRSIRLKNWSDKTSKTLACERTSHPRQLQFGFDGSTLVTGGSDGTVNLWSYKSLTAAATIRENTCEITSLTTTAAVDGTSWHLAISSASGDVSVYHVSNFTASRLGNVQSTSVSKITCLDFSQGARDGRVLLGVGCQDGDVKIQDAMTRYTLFDKTVHQAPVVGVSFWNRTEHLFSCDASGRFVMFDLRCWKVESAESGLSISSIAMHPDSRTIAIGTRGGEVEIRDRRKMSTAIVKTRVHPENAQSHVSSISWQPVSIRMTRGASQQTNANRPATAQRTTAASDQIQESEASPGKNADFPFSPVRKQSSRKSVNTPTSTHRNERRMNSTAVKSLKGSRRATDSRILGDTSTKSLSITDYRTAENAVISKGRTQLENAASDVEASVQKKEAFSMSPPQNSTKGCSSVKSDHQFCVGSSDSKRKSTQPKGFATPQPQSKAELRQKTQTSFSASYRKRLRKAGSFAEFAGHELPHSEAELDAETGSRVYKSESVAYWKQQYMCLREDMLEMQFQLMAELSFQKVEFAKQHRELQEQQTETKNELERLKKMIEQKMNDSITFI